MTAQTEPRSVKTKCCGTITRCPGDRCLLQYYFAGGGKCVRCGWIWDMPLRGDPSPISVVDMKKAHSP